MKELVSVIINVYNGEAYISKCLDSIINQTYKNLEIIIVNDGSTDKTLDICKTYKDKRIRIINQSNKGLSLSRNVGIDNASGKYLYFVDADDYIELDTIEYLYNINKKYKTKIATCMVKDIYNYDFKVNNIPEDTYTESSIDMIKKILLFQGRNGTIWNKLIDKELFNDLRFEDRIINDVVVVYKLLLKVDRIACSNQVKYYYYKHSDSIIGKKNANHAIDYFESVLERYNYINKIYPNLIENHICILLSIITIYSHFNKDIDKYLKDIDYKKIYKKHYSLKVFKCHFSKKDKFKILLFRISPSIYRGILFIYLKIKGLVRK